MTQLLNTLISKIEKTFLNSDSTEVKTEMFELLLLIAKWQETHPLTAEDMDFVIGELFKKSS